MRPPTPVGWTDEDWDEVLLRDEEEKDRRAFMAKYPTRDARLRAIAAMGRARDAGRD